MNSSAISKVFSKSSTGFRQFHVSSVANQRLQKLDGRTAVAVGCTDGIGLAMAKRLAEEGAHVVVSSRKQENVDRAVDGLKSQGLAASGFASHVGNSDDRKALLNHVGKAHGGIDILINNAGVNTHTGPFLDTPEPAFDKVFDINLKSNFLLVREAVPYMEGRKHTGSIVLTSSASGYQPHEYPGAYAVSKSAIFGLIRALMPELLQKNIRINCIALGLFNTQFAEVVANNEKLKERLLVHVPMKRFGEPEECAGIASFLCSDESNYITGETFSISGGSFSRL